jgi:hypothetical protein
MPMILGNVVDNSGTAVVLYATVAPAAVATATGNNDLWWFLVSVMVADY